MNNSKENILDFSKKYFSLNLNVEKFIQELLNIKQDKLNVQFKEQMFHSRLDRKYFPNFLVRKIREIKSKYFL